LKKLTEKIENKELTRDLFDEAQQIVFKLMETACVSQFNKEFYLEWKEKTDPPKESKGEGIFGLFAKKRQKDKAQLRAKTLSTDSMHMAQFFRKFDAEKQTNV
jgi:hypothetical protein